MIYGLRFLPEVEEDAFSAYKWYEEKAQGLGEEFLHIFYAYVGSIPQNPLLYPKAHREFRRRLLIRFPYAVYFRIEDNTIVVYGLFHCARNPRAIITTMQNRHLPNRGVNPRRRRRF